MTAEETLVAALDRSSDLTALVGSRIYPLSMPQAIDLPAVVYSRVSTADAYTLDGDLGSGWARIQIEILASDYTAARAIRTAIRTALQTAATPQGRQDLSDLDRGVYRLVDDYLIYEEVL